MTDILELLKEYALHHPRRPAVISGRDCLTYQELEDYSNRLALYLDGRFPKNREPVAVYGHKHPFMLVCFLACVKSGHAYCPIDLSVPASRVQLILDTLNPPAVFAVEPLPEGCICNDCITLPQIKALLKEETISKEEVRLLSSALLPVEEEEIFYLIFTSGSTGVPKGVQITANCLNHFLDWSRVLASSSKKEKTSAKGQVFLNQAPFSFDLSVMDLYTCLAEAGTLWCLDKAVQQDYALLMKSLGASGADVFVATPSFAELCLADPGFCGEKLPHLSKFLFCGETLTPKTVSRLFDRFPGAEIYNTYGPTESTVAVTGTLISQGLLETDSPLPVGRAKPGTHIEIWDEEGQPVPEGKKGEIIILGDTVSSGYFKNPFLNKKAFFTCQREGITLRGYHTGDKGLLKDGMLFYCGRMDLQVKLHGYRIELEDIERNLLKLPQISRAAVLPNMREHKVKSLSAYVVCPEKAVSDRNYTTYLKQELLTLLPEYMIPKKFIFLNQLPVTGNGKVDRKALKGMVS